MSTALASHSSGRGLVTTSGTPESRFCMDKLSGGAAKCGGGSADLPPLRPTPLAAGPADTMPSLEALPWLAVSGAPFHAVGDNARPVEAGNRKFLRLAGMSAALASLVAGAWYLEGGTVAQSAPLVTQNDHVRATTSAGSSNAAQVRVGEAGSVIGHHTPDSTVPAEARQALITSQPVTQPFAKPRSAAAHNNPATAASITAPPPAGRSDIIDAATTIALPQPNVANSPATVATLKDYRSTVEECRDAIRVVIRLGDRQRPGRKASPEEQASYRLRQQNAEAARGYRSYLETLARSMRGTKSEDVARQSVARARQTLGYLNTMLADSQASLR